jgi:hypothetical protein
VAVSILLELTLVTAALSAKGSERARAIWVTAVIAMLVIQDALVPLLSGLIPVPAEQVLLVSGYFLTPIGLSYALFNRRLLDIGFVLNRTTIFAAVSLIIFAGFNLGEWAVGGWLGTLNRTANAALSAALVLGLGLLLRPLHDGVERVVDRVLFRARYTAERALRKFAHEAAFFNDPKSLIEAAEKTVTTCARATGVVFMREGDERFATIDVDDAALVALRAWHDRLDLHSVNSKIRGEYAFPLTVRGMLTGLMVIGEKDIGEPYAPDELDALDRLALAVGISLDGLERTGVASEDSLTWMRSIDARMNVLTDQLSMLSAAVLGSSNVNASNGAATEAKPPNV